jgi:hypothetical protein
MKYGVAFVIAVVLVWCACGDVSSWPGVPPKRRLLPEEREKVRAEQVLQRALRAAEIEASKKARQTATEANQRRVRAIKETLAELSMSTRKPADKKS